jgi:DNA ligase-associated metallophosphoesterase
MLEARREMDVVVRGETFRLLAERAVFWPSEGVLFVSDLHWGREPYLQSKGFAVPDSAFESESAILASLVARTQAREIWVLGDFVHHPQGLTEALREKLRHWVEAIRSGGRSRDGGVKITLIPGNHDRSAREWAPACGITLAPEGIRRGEFEFQHEGKPGSAFAWYGHLHPSIRIPELLGNRKLPCFLLRRNEAFLPAFSRLAGGGEIGRIRPSDRIYPIHGDEVFYFGFEDERPAEKGP